MNFCGRDITTGASGTLTLTPRYGTVIGGVSIGASGAQTVVPSITTSPFILRYFLIIRALGLPGTNSVIYGSGEWSSGGAVATAASACTVLAGGTSDRDGRRLDRQRTMDGRDVQHRAIRYSQMAPMA